MIKFACGHCGRLISVDDRHAGKKGKCPQCKHVVVVPAVEEEPVEQADLEALSEAASVESDDSLPSEVDEDSDEEPAYAAGRPKERDRRLIAIVAGIAAVVVIVGVILVVVLRSRGSRQVEDLMGAARAQREAATTDQPAQPAASAASSAKAAGAIRLRFRPAPGTKRKVQLTTKVTQAAEEEGQQQGMTATESMDFDLEVLEPPADGTVAVAVSLAAVRLKSEAAGQTAGEYDSAQPPGERNMMAELCAPFLGSRFTIHVSPGGEIADLNLDALFQAAAERRVQDEDAAMRERLKDRADEAIRKSDEQFGSRENRVLDMKSKLEKFPVLGREKIGELLSSMVVALPDKPLRRGDTWQDSSAVGIGSRIPMAGTYTVTSVEPDVCTIQVAGQRSLDEEPLVEGTGQTTMTTKLGGSSNAILRIERQTGWLLARELKAHFQGEVQMPTTGEQSQGVSIPVSVEVTTTLRTLE
ncbi:MAG TPA: DUF6263 family protein [Sedimentisphaerales bacterium]|jgi:phage FluMu protein Com|nr:DUF6263 family protein [Sedimentisphaerales bacterium]HNU29113.1 DUF6263 family protein [Sedimentisphaerales bacterium]